MNISFSPYRVCPIGAHSDFQFGKITAIALDQGIKIIYEPTKDGVFEASSKNFKLVHKFFIDKILPREGNWGDYVRGAVVSLQREHEIKCGLRMEMEGSLPIGGLSSSAALSVAIINALSKANDIKLTRSEIIEIALWSENNYVGVNCGKLDPASVVYCKKNSLLYFDTKNDDYEIIPDNENMKPYEIAIFFSGIERSLISSAFNMRVDELQAAAYGIAAFAGLKYGKFADLRLRDIPRDVFETFKTKLPDTWRKRAQHWYTEFDRVQKGAEAWRNGDIEEYGRLSFESGRSSIENYQTGSEELVKIYDIMLETKGVYGGRFSGAGFKGCCMALIDPEFKEEIAEKVESEYIKAFPKLKGRFSTHFCKSGNGIQI
jgi:galactokinase/galacturonokinase